MGLAAAHRLLELEHGLARRTGEPLQARIALFTANPARQAYIRDDPLALRRATARFLVESVRLDFALRRAPDCVTVPLLLMIAGQDRAIDNERTRKYAARCATADRTVIEYPEAHHTLEFEADPSPVFADLARWLGERAGR